MVARNNYVNHKKQSLMEAQSLQREALMLDGIHLAEVETKLKKAIFTKE